MPKITIDKDKCKGCFLCAAFCSKGLFKTGKHLNKKGLCFVEIKDSSGCLGCALCALICPDNCIKVKR